MNAHVQNAGRPSHALKTAKPRHAELSRCSDLASPMTERAYLFALWRDLDPDRLLADGIHIEHFTGSERREMFTAMTLLLADGIKPDAATLSALVDGATLIEFETTLKENVSDANRAAYVTVLKDYRLKRQLHELRAKLMKAASAGNEAEIDALNSQMKALRQGASSGNARFNTVDKMNHPADVDWLIDRYIERDTITQIFGDPGSGKSFVALDMALSVAYGIAWNGNPTQRGTVFYLAGEGRRGLQRRIAAWQQQHGIHDGSTAPFFISNGACAVSNPDEQAALVKDIDDAVKSGNHQPPALIVVDTLARHFGGGDENSTKDMSAFIAGLDALRERYHCCILLVHHTGHADKSRARGSIALLGSLDAEFRIQKDDKRVTMTSTRQKDNDDPPVLSWTLTRQDLPWADRNGQPLNSAVLVPNDSVPATPPVKEKMGSQQRRALELLEELYRKQQQNLEDAGHDPNTARVIVADWINDMKTISPDSSYRAKLRKWVVEQGHVRIEGPFAYLVER